SRADSSLWRHRQEEMGDQLRLHGDLRVRFGLSRLGPFRLQYGVRAAMVSIPRHAGLGDLGLLYHRSGNGSGRSSGHAGAHLSNGDTDLLPGVDDPGLYGWRI